MCIAILTGIMTGWIASRPFFGSLEKNLFMDDDNWINIIYPKGYVADDYDYAHEHGGEHKLEHEK